MTTEQNVGRARLSALERIERGERNYKICFLAAAVVEALFLGGFLLLADFSNRLHLLLLIASVATYTIVGAGLLALGSHVSRCTWRIIKALEQRD